MKKCGEFGFLLESRLLVRRMICYDVYSRSGGVLDMNGMFKVFGVN